MKSQRTLIPIILAAFIILPSLALLNVNVMNGPFQLEGGTPPQWPETLQDSSMKETAPKPHSFRDYSLSQGAWSSWQGTSTALPVQAYGDRIDTFDDKQMTYSPSSNSTTNTSVEVPLGAGWEGYNAFVSIEGLTENRTWVQDPDMEDEPLTWTLGSTSGASASWLVNGSGPGDDCALFALGADPPLGQRAYARQNMDVPRGDVVWAGFRLDYWVDSNWGADGFVAIYVSIETNDYTQRVWQKSFPDIDDNQTWYDSGLIVITDLSLFDLSDGVDIEVGLYSQQTVNYTPDLYPRARVDNVELYLMTLAAPSDVKLKVDGHEINNHTVAGETVYGLGNLSYTPAEPWTASPVQLEFSWTPDPMPPSPNRTIKVDFSVTVNVFAQTENLTVTTQDPTAYGETFKVENGTSVEYETWYYADIPDGYDERFYFNITLPEERNVYHVGSPLLTTENLTTWDEGEWWARIPAYDHDDRWGYWLIKSRGPNMVQNLLMHHESGEIGQSIDLRANNRSSFITVHDPSFSGLPVNISIFDPSGDLWYTEIASINSTGYAETLTLEFGANASAGEWQVQAIMNNSLADSSWNKTGFFLRSFGIIHSSTAKLLSPADAVGTWIANVTYPDLFLVRILVNDSDITGVTVPGGNMVYNWTDGMESFGDSGTGEYIVTLDSSDLYMRGQHVIEIEWNHPYFDSISESLTINLNWDSEIVIISPDSPSLSGPIGYDQSFRVKFEDTFGDGIDYGVLDCNWSNPYTITEVIGSPGTYDFTLDTVGMSLGLYVVNVTGNANFILPANILFYVTVRELYTEVSYLQNVLQIPVGEARSFTIEWSDADNNVPLTGMSDSIVSNWSLNHALGDMNYTVDEISPGTYNVTIYTVDADPLDTYPVHFNLTGYQMQNHTFVIDVVVAQHKTVFMLDEPIQQTSHGDTIVILVQYRDTDLNTGISNTTGDLIISVQTAEVASLSFEVNDSLLGTGHYNITISTTQWATIGWKDLTISIYSISDKYAPKSINTSVRLLGRQTDLYLENVPVAVHYLQNFSFSIVYLDAVNSTQISNSTENVFCTITPIGPENPATQMDFMIWESVSEPGLYLFLLNSTRLQSTGTFSFSIYFGWRIAAAPLYENQSLTVSLVVLERPAYIDQNPVPTTPYGESTTLEFAFIDSLSTMPIENSSQLIVSLNEEFVSWSLFYDSATKRFFLTIESDSLGGVDDFTLHLNATWTGSPYYSSIQSKAFNVKVILRASQLRHDPFLPGQYGNNITIDFEYVDIVSGSSSGMTGTLTLNISSAYYHVQYLGNGRYRVELDTFVFGAVGVFVINASIEYDGTYYQADAIDVFGLTVSERVTQMGYESPDPTPYQENVTIYISYTDDTTGAAISDASIILHSSHHTLVLDVNYWIMESQPGQYTILLNSSVLGPPGQYGVNITASKAGEPYYAAITRTLNPRVIERPSQILITKTPGKVPFLETISIRFRFEDFLTKELIVIDKSHIILTHGELSILLDASSYILLNYTTYYEIQFNSTILNEFALVSNHKIQILINRSSLVPYYAARSTTVLGSTIERPTQIQFQFVADTPFGDNITIELRYIDYLSGNGINNADIALNSGNLTQFVNYTYDLGEGSYRISIPSDQFGQTGKVYFEITFTRDGIPYYASRTAKNIASTIRVIFTSISYQTPPAGVIPVGDPFIVSVFLLDFDHETPISNATIVSDWTELYDRSYTVTEIGDGEYQVILNTTGLIAQEYSLSITASLMYYANASTSLTVQPGAPTVQIDLERSTYYADWGQSVLIRFTVIDSYYGTPLKGMTATVLFNDTLLSLTDADNGTYYGYIDTSIAGYGVYAPRITVEREYYQTRQIDFTLVVYKATGQIIPQVSTLQIVRETDIEFWVYLNDTTNDGPISPASVSMEWNNTIFTLLPNGTVGFYIGYINASGFSMSSYELKFFANAENHDFLSVEIDVIVIPVPTAIVVQDGATTLSVTFGDMLDLYVEYNDTYYGGYLSGANVTFTLGGYTGLMEQITDGRYHGQIDGSLFSAQTLYLRIAAEKDGYAKASKTIPLNILSIPTEVEPVILINDGYLGDTVYYAFYLNDTHNIQGIAGAEITSAWEGDSGTVVDLGDGWYNVSFFINDTIPRPYEIVLYFMKPNYKTSSLSVNLLVKPTPATIVGISEISIPVNDTAVVIINLFNDFTDELISGVNPFAFWDTLGSADIRPLENGSYILDIPGDLPIGQYGIDISFTTVYYKISTHSIQVTVRQVFTDLLYDETQIDAYPGAVITLRLTYMDTDHSIGIDGATMTISVTEGEITYLADRLINYGNGTYELSFYILQAYTMTINVQFAKNQYQTQSVEYTVYSDLTPGQQAQQTAVMGGGFSIVIIAILLALYVKVFSVPKEIRIMNKMIRSLSKGRVPKPAEVPSRQDILTSIVNDELQSMRLSKPKEDIVGVSVIIQIPEINELLDRLAELTNLEDDELDAFRQDLSRMKPSERLGFIKEVITQEEARRADEMGPKEAVSDELEKETYEHKPEEIVELKKKLMEKGLAEDEIDVILEDAKGLSKADIEALLDSLGINLD